MMHKCVRACACALASVYARVHTSTRAHAHARAHTRTQLMRLDGEMVAEAEVGEALGRWAARVAQRGAEHTYAQRRPKARPKG